MQESEYTDVYEFYSEVWRIDIEPYLHLQRTIRKQASKHCLDGRWHWEKRSEKDS